MTNDNERSRKPLPHPLSKEQRARDATLATQEYEAEKRATVEKTARLRELRLARNAAEMAEPKAKTKKQKEPGKGSKS